MIRTKKVEEIGRWTIDRVSAKEIYDSKYRFNKSYFQASQLLKVQPTSLLDCVCLYQEVVAPVKMKRGQTSTS